MNIVNRALSTLLLRKGLRRSSFPIQRLPLWLAFATILTLGAAQIARASDGAAPPAVNISGITLNSGSRTVNGNVILGGNQTWTNNSNGTLTVGGNVSSPSNASLTVAGSGNTVISGVLGTGSGTLTVNGTGTNTLTLSGTGANTYTGVTTVTSGTLVLDKTAGVTAIGGSGVAGNVDIVINGGTLLWEASNQLAPTVTINMTSGTLNLNGQTETLYNFIQSGGTFITGVGGHLTDLDPTWFGGTNTISAGSTANFGTLNVSGGIDTVQGEAGPPSASSGGVLNIGSGGLNFFGSGTPNVTVNSDNSSAGQIVLNGDVTDSATGNASITNGGSGTIAGTLDLGGATRTFTVSGPMLSISTLVTDVQNSGSGIIKTGTGTLVLSGANTYAGVTTINSGILSTGTSGILADGLLASSIGESSNDAANLVLGGGTLQYANSGAAESTNRLFTVVGGTTTSALDASGANAITFSNTGSIAFTGSNTTQTLTLTGTGAGVLDPILSDNGSGATSLIKSGNGSWTINGANTYSGGTTVNAGTLQIGLDSATTTTGSDFTTTAINNGATGKGLLTVNGGTVDLNTHSLAVAGLSGSGGIIGNSSIATAGSLTIVATGTQTYSGVIADTTAGGTATGLNPTVSVTVDGSGKQTLNGVNTYSGATTVNSGTLELGSSGSISNTSQVTVNSGGTLLFSGNNNINNSSANVTLNSGTIAMGASGASSASNNIQTVGTLTLSSTSTIDFSTFTNNTLHFANSSAIAWTGTLNIYNWTPADSLYFGSDSTGLTTGQLGQIDFFSDNGTTFLGAAEIHPNGLVTPIPEPSTVLVGVSLLSLAVYRERRRFLRGKRARETSIA